MALHPKNDSTGGRAPPPRVPPCSSAFKGKKMHKPLYRNAPPTRWRLPLAVHCAPPYPPLIPPPALKRRDEAAGLKALLMRELCTIQPFAWTY